MLDRGDAAELLGADASAIVEGPLLKRARQARNSRDARAARLGNTSRAEMQKRKPLFGRLVAVGVAYAGSACGAALAASLVCAIPGHNRVAHEPHRAG